MFFVIKLPSSVFGSLLSAKRVRNRQKRSGGRVTRAISTRQNVTPVVGSKKLLPLNDYPFDGFYLVIRRRKVLRFLRSQHTTPIYIFKSYRKGGLWRVSVDVEWGLFSKMAKQVVNFGFKDFKKWSTQFQRTNVNDLQSDKAKKKLWILTYTILNKVSLENWFDQQIRGTYCWG